MELAISTKYGIGQNVENLKWGKGVVTCLTFCGGVSESGESSYETRYSVLLGGKVKANFREDELTAC